MINGYIRLPDRNLIIWIDTVYGFAIYDKIDKKKHFLAFTEIKIKKERKKYRINSPKSSYETISYSGISFHNSKDRHKESYIR